MKKMNQKKGFSGLKTLIFVLLFVCLSSCYDGNWEGARRIRIGVNSKSKNSELTIATAQQWYTETQNPIAQMGASTRSGGTKTFVKPNWDSGKESNRGRYEVVETPLKTRGGHLLMDGETAIKFDELNPDKSIRNTAKMVIMKDLETDEIRSFIMIFVGSYNYLKTTKNMGRNTYLYREPDFDGAVFFYGLDGQFINGWKYKEGKIVATISKASINQNTPMIGTRALVADCTEYCYTYLDQVCDDYSYWEEDDEWGGGLVVVGYCYDVSYEECYEHCSYYDDGSDDDDDWSDPDPPGSVDLPESPSEPNSSSQKIVDKIYDNNSDLNSDDKNKLTDAVAELQKDPVLNKLLQDLSSKNVLIRFTYDNNVNQAHFDAKKGEIVFGNSTYITSDYLREELIHAMQYYGFYGNSMTNVNSNYEFEAKIFQDISCLLNDGACPQIATIGMDDNVQFNNLYYDFINAFIDNPVFTSELEDVYDQMGALWNQYPGTFDNEISPELLKQYFK
ncbi:MAG: hypothetical protein LRY59_03430 [Bacteroides graminisolvens]|nr:hypothetical protein [Bacteroides graminisolvens]